MEDFSNIKVHRDLVVIKRDPVTEKVGSIYVERGLDHNLDPRNETIGTVIAVGKGTRTKKGAWLEPQVSPGDRVIWAEGHGLAVQGYKDVIVLKHEDVMAVV